MELTERFEKALEYATRIHSGQNRKGSNTPFISHLLSICALVLEDGGSEDEAIAALLHDAVEDQGGLETLEEIKGLFEDKVASIVLECSDTHEFPKPPWKERKENYIAKLDSVSKEALRVITADKIHNLRSIVVEYNRIGPEIWKSFKGIGKGQFGIIIQSIRK